MKERDMSKISTHWPKFMLLIYLATFAYFAIDPWYLPIWYTENAIAVFTVIALLICYFKGLKFSNLSYTLVTIALCCQTIGGHYCFGDVPFDFVTKLFGFERNNYDRMGHFMVGFFALPIMEYFESRDLIRSRMLNAFLVVMAIFGVAGIFEIIEWLYADITALINGKANDRVGAAFLGSQGDVWDAQKDMLCDGLGAIFTAIIYGIRYRGKDVKKILGYKAPEEAAETEK